MGHHQGARAIASPPPGPDQPGKKLGSKLAEQPTLLYAAAAPGPAGAGPDSPTVRWQDVAPVVRPESANTYAALRQYTDGTCVTADGLDVKAASSDLVALPYAKTDVRWRIGSYDILGELGRGGMGVVYKAYSLRLCRYVALKMMTSGRFASEADTVRFQNEAMLAARLEHPLIVPVYDAGEHEGHLYFVMAFVEGTGFGTFIQNELSAPPAERRTWLERGVRCLAKTARALDFAHQRGIVHRDIKPDNIIVDAQDEPHVTDFGIAKNIDRAVSLTRPGAIVGTPAYMAPEQANSLNDRIGPPADVYSLGATLYHLATGKQPFEGGNALQILLAVLHKVPEAPRAAAKKTLGRTLDPDLDLIIQKAMEKRAAERYPSAGAMADDLDAYLEDRPVAARPIGALERLKKSIRRNRAVYAMMVVAALTLVTLAVGFGTVLAFNLGRTSESLRSQDEQAALDQAATLERAIGANMVEGRADVVRNLVAKLRTTPELTLVEVVRTDKTLAYTNRQTRDVVARRVSDPAVRAAILKADPSFEQRLDMLEGVGFRRIDAATINSDARTPPTFAIDDALWRDALTTGKPVTRVEEMDGVPHLTVLKPIPNGPACQICHGEVVENAAANPAANPYAGLYGDADPSNRTRAVLVVRRSQAAVEAQIASNMRDTVLVGGGTTLGLIAVLLIAGRLFGVRLRPQRFG